jgi:signal transduction histidine kinase/CheY-like chemotaxis protein
MAVITRDSRDSRTKLLDELREIRRDLEEAERIARVGSWTLDPRSGEATWSPGMYHILGRDPNGPPIRLAEIGLLFKPESVAAVSAAVERASLAGKPWRLELELAAANGSGGTVISIGVAERNSQGTVVRLRGTMQDVTDQRRMEAQLRQSQRLEAVGQLAGGIAHDFNNILTAIRGFSEVIQANLGPDDPNRADLDQVILAADRATTLVRQLLAFSRRQVLRPQVLDPLEVIDGITPLLRRLLGESIELTVAAAPDLGQVAVDPGQLEQVIVNLAVNASDAMPHGGRLAIEVSNVELSPAYVNRHNDSNPGQYICLAVSDTGHGMDAETQARAFEPFFTTKGPDRGTGMGLATVYGIVKQSGGSIYLYSEPGRGTTFKIYLPRADEVGIKPTDLVEPAPANRSGPATVLLVEDDPAVRAYAQRVLEDDGHTVLPAPAGGPALELAAAHEGTIDLLVTDAIMPGMHGAELAERLLAARPAVRVLYVSGFTEHSVIQQGVVGPGVAFLPKPFGPPDLIHAVRGVLDAAG